jgi:hypothetical protein
MASTHKISGLRFHDLLFAGHQISVAELVSQVAATNHGGSRPGNRDPGGDVGEVGCFDEIRLAGACRSQRCDEGVSCARDVGDLLDPRRQVEG